MSKYAEKWRKEREQAYQQGLDAVRSKPYHSPINPYDDEKEPSLHEEWERGATDAGWNDIYYNGVLKESEHG
jgi:hypothetical protein